MYWLGAASTIFKEHRRPWAGVAPQSHLTHIFPLTETPSSFLLSGFEWGIGDGWRSEILTDRGNTDAVERGGEELEVIAALRHLNRYCSDPTA